MPAFAGAVLTGGASTRMGRDKALLAVDGLPMARRVADTLAAAGAAEVIAVGGDLDGLRAAGLDARADRRQGAGPLGGLLTALEATSTDLVAVVACDLPDLAPDVVVALVGALAEAPGAGAALARTDRREPLCAVWRRAVALPVLADAFARGERAVHAAVGGLVTVEVAVDPARLRNVNRPEDLLH